MDPNRKKEKKRKNVDTRGVSLGTIFFFFYNY